MQRLASALRATTLSTPPVSNPTSDPRRHRRRGLDEAARSRHRRRSSLAASTSTSSPPSSTDDDYDRALAKARECVFNHPEGQLLGRAGRRCTLEDGERHALRAVSLRPSSSATARVLLARSLVAQSRGRELEVPLVALEAMRETEAASMTAEDAVALVEAAGVAFLDENNGAIIDGATTGFRSARDFADAVVEAAPAGVKEAVSAAAGAVVSRVEEQGGAVKT